MPVKTDNPRMGRPVTNKHNVPGYRWKGWTNTARRTFNSLYTAMSPKKQWAFIPPTMSPLPKQQWEAIRWNAAWAAADAANGDLP